MLVPRIGALVLLIGLGFAVAQVLQLVYVVAAEGYRSWLAVVGFLLPTIVVAGASALLIMRRHPLGRRLVLPVVALTIATGVVTLVGAPPVGRFLDDYEEAALARGVEVPEYRREQGWSERRYVEQRTSDVRSQGVLGAIGAVGLFAFLARFSPAARLPRRAGSESRSGRTGTRSP
jgi:hypothetical protein